MVGTRTFWDKAERPRAGEVPERAVGRPSRSQAAGAAPGIRAVVADGGPRAPGVVRMPRRMQLPEGQAGSKDREASEGAFGNRTQGVRREMRMLKAGLAVAAMVTAGCSTADIAGSSAGSVLVGVQVSGEAADTAFALFINSDTTRYSLTTGATRSFSAAEGTHTLHLKEIAENCAVSGDNPRSVTVGALQTVPVTFDVACTDNGQVKVTIATTGDDQDDMYTLAFDDDFRTVLVGPTQFMVLSLPARTYSVALRDIASNCGVVGANPVTVTVTHGATAETGFQVACSKR